MISFLQPADLACANWLGDSEVPFTLVFTKADHRKKGGPTAEANASAFRRALAADWEAVPPAFITSARTGGGKTELLRHLAGLRLLHLEAGQGWEDSDADDSDDE